MNLFSLFVIVAVGFLSFNPTLESVGYTRQTKATKWPISEELDIKEYDCYLGVPYGKGNLIGKEAYFITLNEIYGPFLITDVESKKHHPHMKENNLAADTNCKELVHKKGYIITRPEDTKVYDSMYTNTK